MIKITMKHLMLITCLLALLGPVQAQTTYTKGLSVWFDEPNDLSGKAIWYSGDESRYKGEDKPISAGNSARNADQDWESKSLPLGNGSLGANVMGSVATERITLNEKTLWRGGPNTAKGAAYYWNANKQSAHLLDDIRQAFVDGDQAKAARLTRENFNGLVPYASDAEKPFRFGNFTTMGELYIETGIDETAISDYQRILSVDSALAVVQFQADQIHYQRRTFISYPDQAMVIRFSATEKGKQNLNLSYAPNPVSEGTMQADGQNGLVYTGRLDNNNMQFVIRIQATAKGGTFSNADGKLKVTGADEVVFLLTADTDYQMNFDPDFSDPKTYVGVDPLATTQNRMKQAMSKGYDQLFSNHYQDYSTLFNRVRLNLNPTTESPMLPTNKRLERYRAGEKDFHLEELYYQFGRYLLISSSRPGNLPANLQGLWHNNVDGPWRVDYHNNINVQMNYWPACATSLDECMLPMIDFIRTLTKPGAETARSYFGARGWTASISGNIFGFTAPLTSQDMSWNFNPMAGPWLATHVWEYYDYTRDKQFLKETGYELIKSSAQFAVDYLWHKPDGSYTAAPSTSPEHGPVDQGTTFVHAVVREILLNAMEASEILGVDKQERKQWAEVLEKLAPYQIGRYGQLMEWSEDIDDPKDKHRHVNHLFGLHPGHTISPIATPELAEASRVVLEHRGDFATGWSMGWKLNQWARLHDGDHAYKLYGNLLKNGTLDNLWDTHPPFQIDGNFGGVAGVTEMLLQSHMGFIHLLPALPAAWGSGSISGLSARGNFQVSLEWKDNQLLQATIISNAGETCTVRYLDQELTFKTKKGKSYSIRQRDGALKLEN
ncbi:glycosyl hydrolase family 95 catalytic domain-containing protein [Sunxiuqinia rutila]|uniref:glycoside hydrolase family 95 protein n=1 Tax=Sunxiuqinia rutila TaxID=1397841 RepID=UPI003D36DB08